MTFKIVDGREYFYQWDLNRQIIVDDPTIKEVHFCNRMDNCSLVVEVENGIANVPNILLQNGFDIRVFAYDGEATRYDAVFEVKARTQPSDYVYTETEIRRYEDLAQRIDEIERNGISEEAINNAVNKFLEENPVDMTGYATEEYVDEAVSNVSVDLTGYAKESYVDEAITQSVSGLAKKTDIPDVSEFISEIPSEYITESELNAKGYLTQHQDISGKADVNHTHTGYAKSVHTHDMADINGLQIALSDKASIEYVDEAVKNAEVDLTGYATESYVDNAIANIEIPEGGDTDLSNYYTKEEVDTQIESTTKFETIVVVRDRTEGYYFLKEEDVLKIYNNPLRYKLRLLSDEYMYDRKYYTSENTTVITHFLFTAHSFESDSTDVPIPGSQNINVKTIEISTNNVIDGKCIVTPVTSIDLASKTYVNEAIANIDIPETDLTNYYTKLETYSKTEVDEAIANIDIPESGGSVEGAVSYLEAQDLTEEQKNQAKENISAPYLSYEYTNILSNKSQGAGTGGQSVSVYDSTSAKLLTTLDVGTIFVITAANASTNPTFTESIECEVTSHSTAKILTDVTNHIFFDKNDLYFSSSYFRFYKKDTTGNPDTPYTMYLSVDYYKPIYNNPLHYKFIQGNDFLDPTKAFLNVDEYYTKVTLWLQGEQASYPVKEGTVNIGYRNSISNNATDSVVFGRNNTIPSNCSARLVIGNNNNSGFGVYSTSSTSPAYINDISFIGEYLKSSQNSKSNGLVIGAYNDKTSKYIPYSSSTTYNIGDCITPSQSNFNAAVWRCKADATAGKTPPSSGTTGNDYWEYVDNGRTSEYVFTIGNGTGDSARSNAFTVDALGNVVAAGTLSPTGADYAEYFEFEDGNPNREDRIGYLVELSGAKIKLANGTDILGAVSSTMGVIGDAEEMNWHGKYERDEFGRPVFETVEVEREITNEETGETEIIKESVTTKKLSKEYDPDRHYAPRCDRPEWAPIGLLGKVLVRHDGTLSAGDYVKAINGIASKSDEKTNVRVLEVVSENVIRVLIK